MQVVHRLQREHLSEVLMLLMSTQALVNTAVDRAGLGEEVMAWSRSDSRDSKSRIVCSGSNIASISIVHNMGDPVQVEEASQQADLMDGRTSMRTLRMPR